LARKRVTIDIETFPNLIWAWGIHEQDAIAVEQHWQLASMAWKTFDKSGISYASQQEMSEKKLAKVCWDVLNEADIIIGHNIKRFDKKKLNAKFMEFGLGPPSPYDVVDTLEQARKHFKFTSNRLGALAEDLEVGHKLPNEGWSMWEGCMQDDPKCWARMKRYNKTDVEVNDKIYEKMLPWIENHPEVNLLDGKRTCRCGSEHVVKNGLAVAGKTMKQRYRCEDCKAYLLGPMKDRAIEYGD